jgi:hypothetical protein
MNCLIKLEKNTALMSEKTLFNHFSLLFTKLQGRLFRNNTGQAWQGETFRLKNGDLLIKNPRPVHFGLTKGSGDAIGFYPLKINHSHLGKTLPIFTSLEFKTPKGKPTAEQINWHKTIISNNGISMIVKTPMSEDEFKSELNI